MVTIVLHITLNLIIFSAAIQVGFDPNVYNIAERQGFVDLIIMTNNYAELKDGGVLFFTEDGSAVSSGGTFV